MAKPLAHQDEDEGDARAPAEPRPQESGQRQEEFILQLDESPVANQVREFSPQMLANVLRVVDLEVPEAGELEEDDNSHHFACAQSGFPMAMALAVTQAESQQGGLEGSAELVEVKEPS